MTQEIYDNLKDVYDGGKMCNNPKFSLNDNKTNIRERMIVQKNFRDFVKYKGHKLDFRIYVFVERMTENPLIYFYKGFGRVAAEEFKENSKSVKKSFKPKKI